RVPYPSRAVQRLAQLVHTAHPLLHRRSQDGARIVRPPVPRPHVHNTPRRRQPRRPTYRMDVGGYEPPRLVDLQTRQTRYVNTAFDDHVDDLSLEPAQTVGLGAGRTTQRTGRTAPIAGVHDADPLLLGPARRNVLH